jgi:hypothetical protein
MFVLNLLFYAIWQLRNIQNKKSLGSPSVIPARIWLLQCVCRQPASHVCFYLPAECRVNCSHWQWSLNKLKGCPPPPRQTYAAVTLVRCAQSVRPLHFLTETKITFLGIIFVQILQNIASIRNRERWIICTLPELYRLFFKTQADACFIGIYNKFHTYTFQNSLYIHIKF